MLGRKPVPVPLCPPQIPHGLTPGSNPGLRGGRPATNSPSHGTTELSVNFKCKCHREFWNRGPTRTALSTITETRLRNGQSGVRIQAGKDVFLFSKTSGSGLRPPPPASWSIIGSQVLGWGYSGRGVKLTAHLHLVVKLRMSGAILLLPTYTFMAWTTTTLPLVDLFV
jgi:hypothetical protein